VEQANTIPSQIQLLAEQGLRLVPCGTRGKWLKASFLEGWPEKATADLQQLYKWEQEEPSRNWALLTGSENQLWVLDADNEGWLAEQVAIHGTAWTNTRKVRSGRRTGGHHFYFQWPKDGTVLHNSQGKVAPNIDVLGWHALAVVPPSLHKSGRRYTWATPLNHPILEAPPWLLEAAINASAKPARVENGDKPQNGERKIPQGERHKYLVSCAGGMRARGMRAESIEAALLAENELSCTPPKPEVAVRDIAADIAARYRPEPCLLLRGQPLGHSATAGTARPPLVMPMQLFETAAEFTAQAPTETRWLIPPWVPEKSLVELIGKIKSSGKTTLVLAMVRAVLDGSPFLDRICAKSPVVFLSEQSEASLREALQKAGLQNRSDLHLLRWHRVMGSEWMALAAAAGEKASETKSRLICIDTLGQFSQLLGGDAENSATGALEILKPLQVLQEQAAILLVRHERKGDSETSDAGRGSSAYSGAVDVMLRLARLGAGHSANIRRLQSLSRFQTPPDCLIELTADGYELRETSAITLQAAEQAVMDVLPADRDFAMTVHSLIEKTQHTRSTLDRVLQELVARELVKRLGAGVRGCAYKYFRTEEATCS
jgi:hypothetical protein